MSKCLIPPLGWRCTRPAGHTGSCAAILTPPELTLTTLARLGFAEHKGTYTSKRNASSLFLCFQTDKPATGLWSVCCPLTGKEYAIFIENMKDLEDAIRLFRIPTLPRKT